MYNQKRITKTPQREPAKSASSGPRERTLDPKGYPLEVQKRGSLGFIKTPSIEGILIKLKQGGIKMAICNELTYGKDYIAGKVLFFDMGIRQETMSILAKLAEKGFIERKELKTAEGIEYFYNASDLEEWEVIPKI